jgi:hypothetical protein
VLWQHVVCVLGAVQRASPCFSLFYSVDLCQKNYVYDYYYYYYYYYYYSIKLSSAFQVPQSRNRPGVVHRVTGVLGSQISMKFGT